MSNFKQEFLVKWRNSKKYTLEVIEAMPRDTFGYKPNEDMKSFAGEALHICNGMFFASGQFLNVPKQDFEGDKRSKADIISYVNTAYDVVEKAVETIDEFETEIKFWVGNISKRKLFNFLNDHITHHRAKMIVYLRMNGIKPPRYVGW